LCQTPDDYYQVKLRAGIDLVTQSLQKKSVGLVTGKGDDKA